MLLKKLIAWEKQYGHRTVVEFLMNGLGRSLMNGLGRRLINYTLNAQCVRQLPFAS